MFGMNSFFEIPNHMGEKAVATVQAELIPILFFRSFISMLLSFAEISLVLHYWH